MLLQLYCCISANLSLIYISGSDPDHSASENGSSDDEFIVSQEDVREASFVLASSTHDGMMRDENRDLVSELGPIKRGFKGKFEKPHQHPRKLKHGGNKTAQLYLANVAFINLVGGGDQAVGAANARLIIQNYNERTAANRDTDGERVKTI